MILYPLMVNLVNKLVVIIGGGKVACRKATDLLQAEALVKVISPNFHEGFKSLKEKYPKKLNFVIKKYQFNDLTGATLVFSATNDSIVNKAVYEEADLKHIFVNSVDDPPNCSFYVPSMLKKGDLTLAISTCGQSPSLASKLRRDLEKNIPVDIEITLEALGEARTLLKKEAEFLDLSSLERGEILKRIVNDPEKLEKLKEYYQTKSLKKFLLVLIN